jgi:chromatin structure-remodeling complex subunit RSC1/2
MSVLSLSFTLVIIHGTKGLLETEWRKRTILPIPRTSPPPSAPQKVHAAVMEPPAPSPQPPRAATPVVQRPAAQPMQTITTQLRHTPIRPIRSPRPPSPDLDVDVNSATPDPDGTGEDIVPMERDVGSEEIVRQLEKGLPRWEGFGESGWMADVGPVS